MPLEDNLLWVKRISNSEWITKKIHCVSFARLVAPSLNKNNPIIMRMFFFFWEFRALFASYEYLLNLFFS